MEPTIVSGEVGDAVGERTQVVGPGPEVTQSCVRIACPVCRTENPAGERWCRDCGFLLESAVIDALEMPEVASSARLVGEGGREYPLRQGVNSIGRENADVLLLDATVSRSHARLTLEDRQVWIEDEGSTNGTRVGHQPVPHGDRRAASDGVELRFGSVALRLVLPPGAAGQAQGPAPTVPGEEEPLSPGAVGAGPRARPAILGRLVAADGTEFPLLERKSTIGRRSENDIVIANDPYVSGHHAEIVCGLSGCVVSDLGSTNGSFLRDERLSPHLTQTLSPGDELRLGRSVFIFEAVTPSEEPDAVEEVTEGEQPAVEDSPQMNTDVATPEGS